MFRKVLIANRGEIVCRIAATLHEMGVRSVAVYSEADRGALHTRVCDEALPIGPAEARESYLNVGRILEAARSAGVDAIHPGYGFLAENAAFARATEAAGFTFLGPTPDQIEQMGDKRQARRLAERAGVPIVPGAEGRDTAELVAAVRAIGFPVMVKAALGGGGKGMRAVSDERALREAIDSAGRTAAAAFGDASVYVEKQLERPRHIEVQVFGDGRGNAIHLFERECSLQRRHQKVIEEAPSPSIGEDLRDRMASAALRLAREVRYRGVGTVELLLAPGGEFYFLEMNTRLQVEHPVTEWITGRDLVRAQLEVAASGRLPYEQNEIRRHGHAIEARVYAEDAAHDFLPQSGTAIRLRWPHGPFVRVDRGLEAGDTTSVHYDPMLAKIVVGGADREVALARLAGALDATRLHGMVTNLPFLRALARSRAMADAAFDTEWIEREFLAEFSELVGAPAPDLVLAAAAIAEATGSDRAGRAGARAAGAPADAQDAFGSAGAWRHPGLTA
jgi:3-methylcrotonyl-CoA carboxylase alpha subunit